MSDTTPTDLDNRKRQGFAFLREKAVAAHRRGDAFEVKHVCEVAIDTVRTLLADPNRRSVVPSLSDLRWVFSFWLYWLADIDLIYGPQGLYVRSIIQGLPSTDESPHDGCLLSVLFSFVESPLIVANLEPVFNLPREWITARARDPEDTTAISLLVELTWFHGPANDAWARVLKFFLDHSPQDSPLAAALTSLGHRLIAQAPFLAHKEFPGSTDLALGPAADAGVMRECWHAFFDCEWKQLDDLIRNLVASTRVDSANYFPLFSVIHFSRFLRRQPGSQFLSLSRRLHAVTRQPIQVFNEWRSSRFARHIIRLRKEVGSAGADDRIACFVLAMFGELAALRAWDLGGWVDAIRQQSAAHLEVARFGDPGQAAYGLTQSVMAIQSGLLEKDKEARELMWRLDRLPEAGRGEIVEWLLASRPAEWPAANRMLAGMSDSIPERLLPAVARWSVQLETSGKELLASSISELDYWATILPHVDDAPNLVEGLRPALVLACNSPPYWICIGDTIRESLAKATLGTAQELANTMITRAVDRNSSEADARWGIVCSAIANRDDLFEKVRPWLSAESAVSPVRMHYLLRRTQKVSLYQPLDDPAFRSVLRTNILEYCRQFHGNNNPLEPDRLLPPVNVWRVTWPEAEQDLVGTVVAAVNSPDVALMRKRALLDVLANLVERLPEEQVGRIADATLQWLEERAHGLGL